MSAVTRKPKAILLVKRRPTMKAVVLAYDLQTGRTGKMLASEPLGERFTGEELAEAARRMVGQLPTYDVVLPVGVQL